MRISSQTISVISYYDDFVPEMSRNHSHGVPDGSYFFIHFVVRSVSRGKLV